MKFIFKSFLSFVWFAVLLSPVLVLAQGGLVLSGKISNQSNAPIAGASVVVTGQKSTAANAEGQYRLLVPAGKYEITVTAIGYATKVISDVDVANGANNVLDIVLDEKSTELEGVVIKVTRKQESTNALLSFQKNNIAVSSGLAADFIRRTPDKNTGEVLRRVSGASIQDNKFVIVRGLSDRYNAAFINGAALPSSEPDKKAFSFDIIPSALIDNIIISKSASADLTGEFAGGLVQINTKDIPTKNQLMLGIGLGFNTQSAYQDFISNPRGSTDWLGFDNQRKLPSAYPLKYGDFSKLNAEEKLTVSRSFNDDVYREQTSTAGPIQSYNLTWANAARGKNGGTLGSVIGLTYRNSKLVYDAGKSLYERGDAGQAFFDYKDRQNKYASTWGAIANVAWSKGKTKIAFKNLFNQLFEDNYYQRTGPNTENLQNVRLRSSVLNQRSLYSTQLEGTHTLNIQNIKLQWNLNYAYNDKQQPDLRVQTYGQPISDPNGAFNINLRGNNTNRFFSNLNDQIFGYNASAQLPFKIGDQNQSVKIGGSGTVRLRDFRATIMGYDETNNPTLNSLPFDQIFNKENFGPGGFLMSNSLQNPQDKYFGISSLSAAYILFDNRFSRMVRLSWGTRFEYFEQFLKSNVSGTDKAQVINTKKLDFLPSLNLTISPTIKTNIRASASRTVARPEFREIAPFTFFDFEQIASTAGNPNLQRSSIINTDLRYEWYPKAGEVVSIGAFFKDFDDPIELRLNSGSVATRRQYEFLNADKATLIGFEAEFRKSLSFLSSGAEWLNNLYFNGNASFIQSKVVLGNVNADGDKVTTERPLQGQSPYLINAGFQYDGDKGTSISLLYNRIGQRLALVGNNDFGDIYEKPRDLVDFQLSRKILQKKGELKLTISDIFNQGYITYENRNGSKAYQASSDRIFSTYRPGTTFTIGFNYQFDL